MYISAPPLLLVPAAAFSGSESRYVRQVDHVTGRGSCASLTGSRKRGRWQGTPGRRNRLIADGGFSASYQQLGWREVEVSLDMLSDIMLLSNPEMLLLSSNCFP